LISDLVGIERLIFDLVVKKTKKMNKQELENRLIDFAAMIIIESNSFKSNYAGNHLSSQIIRSGTSPALNYGEAQSAESSKDFVHKMGICLKELRESFVCLRIIEKANLTTDLDGLALAKNEANELISIFVSSIKTAKTNMK
jgi:four helix bundle protein